MSGVANVPEIINDFNAYNAGNQLIGVTGAINLPSFDAIMETISGAGVLGEYETAVAGMFGSMEQELSFRILYEDVFSLMKPMEPVDLTLRASQQSTVKSTGAIDYQGMRVVERGRVKKFNPGKLEKGKQMEAGLTIELLYIMIEIGGKVAVELDKLNGKFVVDGVDIMEKVRSLC